MKIEEQVLSIKQMRVLKELGFEPNCTALSFVKPYNSRRIQEFVDYAIMPTNVVDIRFYKDIIPTLTLHEILSLFPIGIDNLSLNFNNDNIGYYDSCGICYKEYNFLLDPLKGVYDLLCWVVENKHLNK